MDMDVLTWGEWFIQILTVVSDSIASLVGLLPNPDPFPEMIAGMSVDTVDAGRVAWFWLDNIIETEFFFSLMTAYFQMFSLAWIIQMIWKWIKAR